MATQTTTQSREFVHNPEFDAYQAVRQFMEGTPIHESNTSEVTHNNEQMYYKNHLIATYRAGNYQLEPWAEDEEARRVKGLLLSQIRKYGLKYSTVFRPRGTEAADEAHTQASMFEENQQLTSVAKERKPRGQRA